jgi:toxin ParE1/3/4
MQSKGLGKRFVSAIDEALNRIERLPSIFPEVCPGVRRALVIGFPYKVIFREANNRIIVIAVYHASRDPAGWQERIDDELSGGV